MSRTRIPADRTPCSACAAHLLGLPNSVYRPSLGKWQLVETWRGLLAAGVEAEVRAGFLHDLASTPGLSWLLGFMPYALGEKGPLAHDLAYRTGGDPLPEVGSFWRDGKRVRLTRKEADQILFQEAICEGTDRWKAKTAYVAVRALGWVAWRG